MTGPAPLARLLLGWRGEVANLRRRGMEREAYLMDGMADDLESALRGMEQEALPLAEAAAESGYSPDHLGRLVRDGTIPNAGRKHAPRICRSNLPRRIARKSPEAYDAQTDARDLQAD